MLLGEYMGRPTYKFLQTIGEGSQSICRRAYQDVLGVDVVQKTVSTFGSPESAVRANEPALLHRIKHDRIVRVQEAQWDPDPDLAKIKAITFVMPYYPEGSVYDSLVTDHRFSVRDTIQVAGDILAALHVMHVTHGLIHRDVKPSNILLESNRGRAVLADLGGAAFIDPATGGSATSVGSDLYRAPEARPSGLTTVAGDLFAVGVVMLEMLNGRFPYETIDDNDVVRRLAVGRRALADRWYEPAPWIPGPLSALIRSLCHRDPRRRPADAASALTQLLKLRVVDWHHPTGDALTGTWIGYWPPQARRTAQRITEVTIAPIIRSPHHGKLHATTRWRRTTSQWRNYAKLSERLANDRSAVSAYFTKVDRVAQSAPAA
ncbi:serine/threonine-protein kinase [Cellulomonas sp.]|uniref:serine/threonine-protein kinase n=1 Tax=Cellulomonas sp. TaxID=40001 RepID=UPI003BABF006